MAVQIPGLAGIFPAAVLLFLCLLPFEKYLKIQSLFLMHAIKKKNPHL